MIYLRRLATLRLLVALALIAVVVLGGAIWLRTSRVEDAAKSAQQQPESPYQPVPLAKVKRLTALFVGDDFTGGFGGVGRNAYPRIVCNAMEMNCNVDAQPNTGLVSDGRQFSPDTGRLIDRLPVDERLYTPDLVIVDGGREDHDVAPSRVGEALAQYLERVATVWPASKIVVIAPTYFSAEPYDDYSTRIAVIRGVVQSFGATLIDPIAEKWYDAVDTSTKLQADNLHPNQAGHEYIAAKLEQSLRSRGIG